MYKEKELESHKTTVLETIVLLGTVMLQWTLFGKRHGSMLRIAAGEEIYFQVENKGRITQQRHVGRSAVQG